ncbi:hypothetical protein ANO11243_028820 [Dothideomycetidae sp. 11243]|nr:hypothetical protein ANO11243_028820 [fungal sp. No.11243]
MKKFSIAGVFLLAFAGLGASIVRTVLYYRIFYGGEAYSLHHDSGLANTEVAYFSMLEAGLSLVAVNLPTLWYLFTTVVPEKAQRGLRSPWSDGSIGSKNSNRLGHEKHSAAVRETQIATKKDHISTYDSDSNGALHLPPFMGDLEAGAHQPPSTRHV